MRSTCIALLAAIATVTAHVQVEGVLAKAAWTCSGSDTKYYALNSKDNSCGEVCMNASLEDKIKHIMPLTLLKAGYGAQHICNEQGYATYTMTQSRGVWPLQVNIDMYVKPAAPVVEETLYLRH